MLRLIIKEIIKPNRNISCVYRYSSNSSSSDEESTPKDKRKTQIKSSDKLAVDRLNTLLKQIIEQDVVAKSTTPLKLARPAQKRSKLKTNGKISDNEKTDSPVVAAAKVAELIGGNQKQTESELLQKLLSTNADSNNDLSKNLSDIIKGMKIDREVKPSQVSRADQVRLALQSSRSSDKTFQRNQTSQRKRVGQSLNTMELEKVELFGKDRLGIFSSDLKDEGVINKTWNKMYQRELSLAVTHPPSNYFQEMILWTQQGKIWRFPIDNEQDLEERFVPFTEHVFLDKYLEPWCPKQGPIRHFMELVCVGLSKNPYLSVQEKKDHIEWFKDYFAEKQRLLKDVGAIPAQHVFDKNEPKKLEAN